MATPASTLDQRTADLRASAMHTLERAVARHHPSLALACSFQKEESVLIHMLQEITPDARVFTIDTGVLFPETYTTWRELEQRTGVNVEIFDASNPDGTPWSASNCCGTHKVAALERALADLDAWVTGLRREQSPTRADAAFEEWDGPHQMWKFNPLADWTEKDVWRYVMDNDLPYNALHDQGYSSIGCAPCTQPGSGREGRWAGSEKTECGLHVVNGTAIS